MKNRHIVGFALWAAPIPICIAQAICPPGFISVGAATPSNNHCIPEVTNTSLPTPTPREQRLARYGAIAGSDNVILGFSKDQRSKRSAKLVAINDCKSKGGLNCSLDLEYNNQCAAIVSGENTYATASGISEQDATDTAMEMCIKNNEKCEPYYANCTDSVPAN